MEDSIGAPDPIKYPGVFVPPAGKWRDERTDLELAGCIALSLEPAHQTMWANCFWPSGCCFNTVLLVAPAIRMALEWEVVIVLGVVAGRPHARMETPDSDLIDPTYGAFDRGPPLRVLPAAQSELLGHIVKLRLTRAQEEHFRGCLKPRSSDSGWDPDGEVLALFRSLTD